MAKETCDEIQHCPKCGSMVRPDVVLFGEYLPEDKVRRLHAELHERPPDLLLMIGTTALFSYVEMPVAVARRAGSITVEVNPEETAITAAVDFWLQGAAGRWLPLIERQIPGRDPDRKS